MADVTRISVVGTGNMGGAVAERLLATGHIVTVFNRTREKTDALKARGAVVANSAADALAASEFIILGVFDGAAVKATVLTPEARMALVGRKLMNIAYTTPDEIVEIAAEVGKSGGSLSEMNPVCYPDTVRAGETETVFAGPAEDEAIWKQILGSLGPKAHYVGAVGNASKHEMAVWLPYAFQTIAAAYGAAAYKKLGLPDEVIQALLSSNVVLRIAGADDALPTMASRSYGNQQWSIDNFIASMDMVIENTRHLGMPAEVFEAINNVYKQAAAKGFGSKDLPAVFEALMTTD